MKKIKKNKGKLIEGHYMCVNCNKEYNEKDNFAWKCRTHKSDFSEETNYWWCCGKLGKEQPGCKFSKHECNEDLDTDDENIKNTQEILHLKNTRCQCCKQIGHKIEDCPRDPNMKTNANAKEDEIRMAKMKGCKKIFADT